MSTPLKYRFYAFDFALQIELDCLLYFDTTDVKFDPNQASLSLDLAAHTSSELAKVASEYFHSEYSVDIDEVSITSFLQIIKSWVVASDSSFAHFSVVNRSSELPIRK